MVQFFCPSCWEEVAEASSKCPYCGVEIESFWDRRDFVEKLIQALRHPESQTPVRAAWLLGQLGDPRAVGPLVDTVRRTTDVFLGRAVVEALGRIDSDEARVFLLTLIDHPVRMIADEAQKAVNHEGLDGFSGSRSVDQETSGESYD